MGIFLEEYATDTLPAMHAGIKACRGHADHQCTRKCKYGPRKMASTQDPCMICLEDYDLDNPEEDISRLQCGHQIHTRCLTRWLIRTRFLEEDFDSGLTCPYCRQPAV